MEKMNQLGIYLVAFIAVIVGIALVSSISGSLVQTTTLSDSVNESITFSNSTGPGGTNKTTVRYAGVGVGLKSVSYFANQSNDDLTSQIGTNVNWTSAGVITIARSVSIANNTFYITYKYGDSSYTDDANSRTLIKLIGLFFVLGVFSIGIWYVWKGGLQDMV